MHRNINIEIVTVQEAVDDENSNMRDFSQSASVNNTPSQVWHQI